MNVRTAEETDLDLLANIWYDGWQDAHAQILPAELARHRTLENFRNRLQSTLQNVRVAGPPEQPLGLCITKGDELYQLYVSASARGSGLAAALLADAEERLCAHGVQTAWLACAIGNTRAAKFYEKHSWCRVGNMISQLQTPDGVFPLEVWRYEKDLNEARRPSVGVAHVVLETSCMESSSQFMRNIGMRPIWDCKTNCVTAH